MIPPQLGLLNSQLKSIFGEKYSSVFMSVKPSQLLWDGIPLCVDPSGIAGIICSVIKSQNAQAIHEMSDGSLRFSLFGHVSNKNVISLEYIIFHEQFNHLITHFE